MGWAAEHIAKLQRGETVSFRPTGRSMEPRIMSGQLCTVAPVKRSDIMAGDTVLCRVKGREYLHLVLGIANGLYLIGNVRHRLNGWIEPKAIYGRLVKVAP